MGVWNCILLHMVYWQVYEESIWRHGRKRLSCPLCCHRIESLGTMKRTNLLEWMAKSNTWMLQLSMVFIKKELCNAKISLVHSDNFKELASLRCDTILFSHWFARPESNKNVEFPNFKCQSGSKNLYWLLTRFQSSLQKLWGQGLFEGRYLFHCFNHHYREFHLPSISS